MRTLVSGLAISAIASVGCFAQSVISAHSGVIHYAEGAVSVNEKAYEPKTGEFTELKDNQLLKTDEGRVEVLLTPGVFLRIGENSSVRMVSNRLSDTRVEMLQGEALVECDELLKDNQVTILYKDASVGVAKAGLYRFDTVPGRLRVYDGEAIVRNESGQLTAKKGQEVSLNGGALIASKFDTKAGDELMRWAARRSGYISMANVAAARSADSSGYGSSYGGSSYGGYGYGYGSSLYNGWAFNPYFGMFTFVPMNGILYSPFGDPFWSPYSAFMYAPGFYPYYGYGYYGGYGGYSPITTASTFNPTGRSGSNPYSGSRVSHTAPIGSGGGFSGRGYSGSSGSSGSSAFSGSRSSASAVSSGGFAGGGHMSGGGGHR